MNVPYDAEGRLWNDALDLSESCFDHLGRRRDNEAGLSATPRMTPPATPHIPPCMTPRTTPRTTPDKENKDSERIRQLEAKIQRLTQYTRVLEHTLKAFLVQRSESMRS